MTYLPKFHDATLKHVDLQWETATVSLTLKVGPHESDIEIVRAQGVTDLHCPRQLPWGRSNSVNEATVNSSPTGKKLILEMQSGDVIEIHCAEVALEPTDLVGRSSYPRSG